MVTIRDGRPTDERQLRSIQESTLTAPSPDLLAAGIDGPLGLFVADDGGPVGYALLMESADTALLLEIAVATTHQGEGIGSELLERVFTHLEATGAETVRLTAHETASGVHRFYERHGFERGEVLDGFFESGDAVVFTRELRP